MWQFFAWFFTFRGRPLPRFVHVLFTLFVIGILIAGLIYTYVFLRAANERSHAPHVHAHHTH
jgi:hypothetical protein